MTLKNDIKLFSFKIIKKSISFKADNINGLLDQVSSTPSYVMPCKERHV